MSFSKVMLLGLVGKPEKQMTQTGLGVLKFGVGISKKVRGEYQTTWHNCVMFTKDERTDYEFKKLQSSKTVFVEGEPRKSKYTDKQGVEREKTEFVIYSLRGVEPKTTGDKAEWSPRYGQDERVVNEKPKNAKQATFQLEDVANITADDIPF